ncbi:TonB-dependent receptor [Tellurirhabdus rosea]|uniref:TonB-dependent receptor n=1 Tax=Tellurirhabdus rosea TaxID=2674997 RepID=UPI00224EF1C5|nr:TonB-dependent receptor [Tellurirhabdus rosea]
MSYLYQSGRASVLTGAFLLLSFWTWAQGVRGRITDAGGNAAIPGATVLVTGTSIGTTADAEGGYTLRLDPGSYTLRFSFVGYETRTVPVQVQGTDFVTVDASLSENTASLGEIVVVGSRSAQTRTSTETVSPVDVIQSRDLVATGQVEPTQQLNFAAPSFNSARQTIADGTDHIDPATLRGLGPDQVLVLLNGKRRHNQALINVNGTVGRGSVGTDLNAFPAAAIERIEVLREGAASQYGSDAIAGVINIVLKDRVGTSVTAQLGQQYAGDGEVAQIGVNHGFRLGRRGILSVTGEFRHRGATNRAGDYTGPVYVNWNVNAAAGEDRPALDARRQALYAQDQQLIQQNGFSLARNIQVGNSQVDNLGLFLNTRLPIGRGRTEFYGSAGINSRAGKAAGLYRYPFQTTQIIPELYPNGFLPNIETAIGDVSLLLGVRGESAGWRWDISNVLGGNAFRYDVSNSNNASQFALGAAAPREFYAGTLSFGQNTFNAGAAKDFGRQLGLRSFNVAAGIELRGDAFRIEAGEEASYTNYAPNSGRPGGAQVFPGFQPVNEVNASRSVAGAYLDLESDITARLLVNTAVRFENYSDFGGNVAGKLSFRYKFAEAFSLRGTLSNGFRAPSIHQRYYSSVATQFVTVPGEGLVPRQLGTFRNDSDVARAFGIPSLTAERSLNYSLGVTSRPVSSVSITVDAYQIEIRDRIILTGQFPRSNAVVNTLLAPYPEINAAAFFTNAVNTRTRGLDVVAATNQRLGKGSLDLTLAANFNRTTVFGDIQRPTNIPNDPVFGNLLFNRQERGRLELAQPRNKILLSANYRLEKLGVIARVTRFGEVETLDATNPNLDERFSPKFVTDLSLSYRLTPAIQLIAGANNLFDVYPDKLQKTGYPTPTRLASEGLDNTSFGRFVYSRSATQFGFNGGYYFLTVAANF